MTAVAHGAVTGAINLIEKTKNNEITTNRIYDCFQSPQIYLNEKEYKDLNDKLNLYYKQQNTKQNSTKLYYQNQL